MTPATDDLPAAAPRSRTAVTRPRWPALGRRPRIALLIATVAAGGLAAGLLAFSEEPSHDGRAAVTPVALTPLRVTSGGEIATGFALGRDRVVTVAHVVDG